MPKDDARLACGLTELARQVRCATLPLLDPQIDVDMLWTLPGTSNHMLWHAGHALWVIDVLDIEPLIGQSELPTGWAATFGQDSRPATNSVWPDVAEVRQRLEKQLDRFCTIVAEQEDVIVQQSTKMSPHNGWPLLPGIIHGWHDEARHQGEMYLLLKLWRTRQ
jgi:hypothetical protein